MTRAFFIFLLSLFFSRSYADSPPCWCSFEEKSTNKKYIAVVNRPEKDSLVDPWNSIWTLSVYEAAGNKKRLLWKMKYDYTGYPGGLLSDDGQTFIYVEFWYYADTPLVDIYRQGKKINTFSLKGRSFNIPEEKLVQTVSHHLWLKEEGTAYSYFRDKTNRLLIKILTIDGRTHFIDIKKGRLTS